ncbi:MAG: hypothetical protein XD97_0710 [Pelotomaculum thermopropionicum]|uniref:DNA replication initiation control protein YabA n=1 Tax=Pelotomaculum thermopropionicum TaxID=110500 RepID=A0A124FYH7_9FIRM|nr:MAG: hypothetical protein XD97_0710 [Pelotomaculum thermopropionicum]
MQSYFKLIREMEVKLHSILGELQELKNRAQELEEENAKLRADLAIAYREGCSGNTAGEESGIPGRSFLNLLELYDQEFHICNLHFGRRRSGECLFCMAFLRREMEPDGFGASG